MKLSIFMAKDRSKTASPVDSKTPVVEMKGVPARVTSFRGATRTHGREALAIILCGRIRSVVASAGEMKLYLSPRAKFRLIEPDPPKAADEMLIICPACEIGKHAQCVNYFPDIHFADFPADLFCECTHGGDEDRVDGKGCAA
jgi:hypothetical protein